MSGENAGLVDVRRVSEWCGGVRNLTLLTRLLPIREEPHPPVEARRRQLRVDGRERDVDHRVDGAHGAIRGADDAAASHVVQVGVAVLGADADVAQARRERGADRVDAVGVGAREGPRGGPRRAAASSS